MWIQTALKLKFLCHFIFQVFSLINPCLSSQHSHTVRHFFSINAVKKWSSCHYGFLHLSHAYKTLQAWFHKAHTQTKFASLRCVGGTDIQLVKWSIIGKKVGSKWKRLCYPSCWYTQPTRLVSWFLIIEHATVQRSDIFVMSSGFHINIFSGRNILLTRNWCWFSFLRCL